MYSQYPGPGHLFRPSTSKLFVWSNGGRSEPLVVGGDRLQTCSAPTFLRCRIIVQEHAATRVIAQPQSKVGPPRKTHGRLCGH